MYVERRGMGGGCGKTAVDKLLLSDLPLWKTQKTYGRRIG